MDEQELNKEHPGQEQEIEERERNPAPEKEPKNSAADEAQLRLEQELEQERLHQERHAKRIAAMKKEKERQAMLRSKMKLYIGIAVGCMCLTAVVIAGIAAFWKHEPKTGQAADPQEETDLAAVTNDSMETQIPDPGETQDTAAADGETEAGAAEDSAEASETALPGGNGIFFPGYTAQITEDTPYISNEEVISSYAILLDLDTGEVVAQRDAKAVISPASMTKILTLLVAAEHVTDLDDTFTMTLDITDYAYVNDCSTAGFLENEVVTVRDLMYGTILPSGGEAAAALAVYTAGSLDAFVEMMNDKLAELGLSGTAHFTNCVGLYDEDHHCSVYDMAMILKAAAENELCRDVLSAHTYTTSATKQHPEGIILSNWFLRRIEDKDTHGEVVCAKTGFVNQSGNCGASYAVSNSGKHYICVTGNAWSAWRCIYDQVAIYQEYTS